jgi:hypothetical protein
MALAMTASHSEEDFAFEMPTAEEQEAVRGLHTHPISTPVQKLWGIPDTVATVGKLFHMKIPGDAFSGDVGHYEVSSMIANIMVRDSVVMGCFAGLVSRNRSAFFLKGQGVQDVLERALHPRGPESSETSL